MTIKIEDRVPKPKLQAARGELTQDGVAQLVNDWLSEHGFPATCSGQYVSRWETGAVVTPDPRMVHALCAIYHCRPEELGLADPGPLPGYRAGGTRRLLSLTARSRNEGPPPPRSCTDRAMVHRAIGVALDRPAARGALDGLDSNTERDANELTLIEQRLRILRELDDITGTDGVYDAALSDVHLLAHVMQTCESQTCYDKCAALAAQALTFAAFAAFDQADLPAAQALMGDAQRLCAEFEDYELRAHVLVYCALYAAYAGQHVHAEKLAAEVLRVTRRGTFTCRTGAWVFVMLARVYALCGVKDEVEAMVLRAKAHYSDCDDGAENPDWIHYFDRARFTAYIGVCYADAGLPQAAQLLREAIAAFDHRYHRARAHYGIVLASLLKKQGDPETAGKVATNAVLDAERVSSPRIWAELTRLHDELSDHEDVSSVREFTTRIRRVG